VTIRAPVITTRQSTHDGRQNNKAHRVNNYQYSKHKYLWKPTVFTVLNTMWTHMCVNYFLIILVF